MQSASALDWCTEDVKAHILKVDFEWDEFGDGFRWDDVVAGITLYKTLYGELPHDEFKVRSMTVKALLVGFFFFSWQCAGRGRGAEEYGKAKEQWCPIPPPRECHRR